MCGGVVPIAVLSELVPHASLTCKTMDCHPGQSATAHEPEDASNILRHRRQLAGVSPAFVKDRPLVQRFAIPSGPEGVHDARVQHGVGGKQRRLQQHSMWQYIQSMYVCTVNVSISTTTSQSLTAKRKVKERTMGAREHTLGLH